jgi:hypothetical protein
VSYLDTYLLCSLGERVQCHVSSLGRVFGVEPATGLGDQLARWILADHGDDLRALIFCNAGLTAGARTVTEPIDAPGIEAVDVLSYGLGVAVRRLCDLGGTQFSPAQGDDARTKDPVTRRVAAAREVVDLPFFFTIFRFASTE